MNVVVAEMNLEAGFSKSDSEDSGNAVVGGASQVLTPKGFV